MDRIKNPNDINTETAEGKLLLMAIGRLMTTKKYEHKTPEEIIDMLKEVSKTVF
jgi:hypothetical protein